MELTKRIYNFLDMEEQDIEAVPSLDIPSIIVEKYFTPRDHGKYMLFLANIRKSTRPSRCPFCGGISDLIFSGRTKPRVIHDVMRNNCRVDIIIQPARIQCNKCNQRFVALIDGIDEIHSMTTRLLDFLRVECFLQSHTVLAERSGVSVETVRNIMDEEIQKYEDNRKANPLLAPRVLGIDEKHINHVMRGTLVDIEEGLLLDMLEDNKSHTMQEAIKRLRDWDSRIKVVTTDMNNSYLHWLPDLLPNATVVVDKFHVIQDIERRISITKSQLYEYRKNIIFNKITDPKEKLRQMGVFRILNDNKRLFNYSMESIVRDTKSNKSLKLATVIDEFPEFRLLRKLYYLIELMYTKETIEEAEAIWDEWVAMLPPSNEKKYKEWCDLYSVTPPLFGEFRSFVREGFQKHKPYILNYFKPGCRHTNAATEGLNNLIGSINQVGNGYSFKILRAKCLYASLIHERYIYGIDTATIKKWKPTMSWVSPTNPNSFFDTYCNEDVNYFISSVEAVDIRPPNVYTKNEQLLRIIEVAAFKDKAFDEINSISLSGDSVINFFRIESNNINKIRQSIDM